ncbi:MAG: hemolysin family protein [Mesorhizobium sp.]|nr:hemolysin family protein [Mesorhizobium sp.]
MNDQSSSTAQASAGGDAKASEQASDPQSTTTRPEPARVPFFDGIVQFFRARNGTSLREDLADALSESASNAESFSPAERAMLNNILRLREVRVEDVMIPRTDIQAVDITTTLGELLELFEASGHSRMPIYSETLDDPRGMIHIRDAVGHITRTARQKKTRGTRKASTELDLSQVDLKRPISELGITRSVLFVPPSMLASDLMARMQASRTQIALVIDEYGGTDGLVSLEDIVEMVVGDIEDEHDDDEEPMITETGEGVFVVDAKADIDEVAARIGSGFSSGEHGDYVDTIGGMIFNTLGRIPARGEVVQAIPGFEFHVLDADPRRVKRVRIVPTRTAERRRRSARDETRTGAEAEAEPGADI